MTTTKAAHTSRPWTCNDLTVRSEGGYRGGGLFIIAEAAEFVDRHESEANARLIAAAPDLLTGTDCFATAHSYFDLPEDHIVMMDEPNNLFITAGDIRAILAARAKATGAA